MAHIHEKIDYCADVVIVNGDAVLLRVHDKNKLWGFPGGHIELDEDPTQAAIREAREEVGLEVTLVGDIASEKTSGEQELLIPRFINRHPVSKTHEHIVLVYFGTSNTRAFNQGSTEVSEEIHWFTKEDLDNPKYEIRERIKFYARTALAELGAQK